MTAENKRLCGMRASAHPIDDWIGDCDYVELYDELFSRQEQGIGPQIHPIDEKKNDGGDE